MQAEYYNENGKLYRKAELLKVEMIDGIATGTVMKMSDLESGGYTLTQTRGIHYNLGIPDPVFSERSLRNPPREWLESAGR